jgi:hypothetical protein
MKHSRSQHSRPEPLLTEFDDPQPAHLLLRPARRCVTRFFALIGVSVEAGVRPVRAALIYAILGNAALLLSFVGRAHYVQLRFESEGRPFTLELGYLHDVSAGLFFAMVAPFIVGLGLWFVKQSHANLSEMRDLGQIKPGDIRVIEIANRKLFNSFVLLGLVVGSFGFTFGQEFLPVIGDRYNLPFGYFQADVMATYAPHIPLPAALGPSRAAHLRREGRFAEPEKVFLMSSPRGPVTISELTFFRGFVLTALTTHSLFAVVVFWILFKTAFIFWLYAAGIANGCGGEHQWFLRGFALFCKPENSIKIKINEFDPGNRFGLSSLVESLNPIGWLITLCVATLFLEVVKTISGDTAALENRTALATLNSLARWDLFLRIRGPGGAGYFAIVFALLSIGVLAVIDWDLRKLKKARLRDYTLTAEKRSILRSQDLGLLRQVMKLGVPGSFAAGSLLTLLYQKPERIIQATIFWAQLVQRLGNV